VVLWGLLLAPIVQADQSSIAVPIQLDYPLLRQALLSQLFNTADGTRDILEDPDGCNQIVLHNPRIGARQNKLEILADVKAKLGVSSFGACQQLINWQGGIGLLGLPVIQAGGKSIKLDSQQMWLLDQDGNQISSGPLWEVGNQSLKVLLDSFVIDFTPTIDSLGTFLPDVLPDRSAQQLQAIINSLTLSDVRVSPENLGVSINAVIETLPKQPSRTTTVLSEEELLEFESRWQMMDALLVGAVKRYAAATSLQSLRGALLDILIDSRYQLRDALTEPPGRTNDAVRHWFIQSWQSLAPVVRTIALEQPGQEPLLWFSVLSATDALNALDQLGPGIGLDISSNGLRRLARMINAAQPENLLRYSEEVDPELQQLLKQQLEEIAPAPLAMRFNFSLLPRAHAAQDLNRWVPGKDELQVYLPTVAALLDKASANILRNHQLNSRYRELYQKLVLATAWQESCWRQYVVANKRIEPLRSSTGDVGIMQINERVWRGFYDLQKLRWDIDYNSNAGAEVLFNYLVKYAIKRGEQQHPGGINNLARSSYSAYNGGPSQVSRYRKSNVAATHRKVDELFWEKYRRVDAGNAMNVAQCLGGEVPAPGKAHAAASTAAKTTSAQRTTTPDAGTSWVLAQPATSFTLQLAAFSSKQAASDFIRKQSLPNPVHILAIKNTGETRYLVLQGSYPQRSNAEPVKAQYGHLKPWLRQFGELQI
jgi:hypothetical protein